MDDEARLRELVRRAENITQGVAGDIRAALAAEVFRRLADQELPGGRGASTVVRIPVDESSNSGGETLGEYLAGLPNLSHPTRLVAIAAFRLRRDGDALTTDDLLKAYAEVRTPRPQNISANLSRCMRRGWLVQGAPQNGQRAWRVTQRGLAMLRDLTQEG